MAEFSPGLDLAAEARLHDPDRWLCALFAPARHRDAAMALIVLNHELARVPEVVTQPLAGTIRYQWWRDAIESAAAGRPLPQPVLQALAEPLAQDRLDSGELLAMVDARERDLDRLAPEDLTDLEGYAEATSGALQAGTARLLGAGETEIAAARAIGTAYGLIGILRATAALARQDRMALPRTLTEAAGIDEPSAVLAAASCEAVRPAIRRICERAVAILDRPRPAFARGAAAAALPAVLARDYARRIAATGFDPRLAAGLRRPPTMPLRLWWAFRRAPP
jgi:phytoene synthase